MPVLHILFLTIFYWALKVSCKFIISITTSCSVENVEFCTGANVSELTVSVPNNCENNVYDATVDRNMNIEWFSDIPLETFQKFRKNPGIQFGANYFSLFRASERKMASKYWELFFTDHILEK